MDAWGGSDNINIITWALTYANSRGRWHKQQLEYTCVCITYLHTYVLSSYGLQYVDLVFKNIFLPKQFFLVCVSCTVSGMVSASLVVMGLTSRAYCNHVVNNYIS